jgi:outer membrane lipoprotein carrier protein
MQNNPLSKFALSVVIFGVAFLHAVPLSAASDVSLSAQEARQTLADFMQAVTSLHAGFEQSVIAAETADEIETESGELWLQRPGQFRWRYSEPSEREIIADLENIWLYDADLDQVTVRPVENAVAESPAALLVGDIVALDQYVISGRRTADGMVRIALEPIKANGDFQSIELGFAANELALLELNDRFGQRTTVRFSAVERNLQIAPSVFEFILPDGADVIDQRVK